MERPKISIIIPTYNRGHLIKDSVKSVLNQSYNNWELLIVDDGSDDKTEEVIKRCGNDDRIMYVKRPANYPKGANACRNYGFEISRGAYIKWLDSDDLLNEECLEKQLQNIEYNKADVDFCNSWLFSIEQGKFEIRDQEWSSSLSSRNVSRDLITGKLRWPTLAGLWKREAIPHKPYNERIQNSQEWLFHIEMSLKALKYSFTEEALCLIRSQKGSMSDASNKNGNYYYHSALARLIAINELSQKKYSLEARKYLLKKFLWLYLFTLYKGDSKGFLLLTSKTPGTILKTFL